MRLSLLIYLILFLAVSVHGQTLTGTVIDGETTKPLYTVTVINVVTGERATTDSEGRYSIHARGGDSVSFALRGYRTISHYAVPGVPLIVNLMPLSMKLPAYTVNQLTQFQKDSVAMTQLYSKELDKKPVKVGFSSANGGGFTGLIGGPIQKISRSYKQNKRFKENFKTDMEQKYIDTKYTLALVNSLTGLTGDTLIAFMNTFPMEYDFARHGSDLEIKVWIRENYKAYRNKKHENKGTADSAYSASNSN